MTGETTEEQISGPRQLLHIALSVIAYFAIDVIASALLPASVVTPVSIAVLVVFLVGLVALPLYLYRRGRRTGRFVPEALHRD